MKYYLQNSYSLMQATDNCGDCFVCPQKLYLDITENCNLYCAMCRDTLSASGREMPQALFERMVDETAPYVRSYSLFNWGEPLMARYFKAMTRYVNAKKRADCTVEISSNGMLLTPETIEFLASERVAVIVSVDGADKATFEGIRRGASFERVMDNARALAARYAGFPARLAPEFYVSVQKANSAQLADIVRLAASLGIRRMGFGLVTAPARFAPEANEALCRALEDAYALCEASDMLLDLYPTKVGAYVLDGGQYRRADNYIVSTLCPAPLVSATIDYKGDVYLCCNVGERVGSVRDASFLALWQSAAYARLRSAVNDENAMPDRCRGCSFANRNA